MSMIYNLLRWIGVIRPGADDPEKNIKYLVEYGGLPLIEKHLPMPHVKPPKKSEEIESCIKVRFRCNPVTKE